MAYNRFEAGEVIGSQARIIDSFNKEIIDISGEIVMETRNMLIIRTLNGKIKSINKMSIKEMAVSDGSCGCFISGSKLIGKPEDRVSIN